MPFRVFTNGTAKPPAAYAASLRAAGFDLADAEMMTPSVSAALWFEAKGLRRVRVLGKASRVAFEAALRAMGLPRSAADGAVVVGDDAQLEMAMARTVGAVGIAMTTGILSPATIGTLPPAQQPQAVISRLSDLTDLL